MNQAESFFSRLRRAEYGVHHRISGQYLYQYANERAWHEDNRRVPNGMQYSLGLVVGPVRREEKWFNGANAEESNSQLLIGQSKPGDRPGGDEYGSETRWFEFGWHPHNFA